MKKTDHTSEGEGVSPVVGEMLMLSLVLILASLFAVSASQFIPEEREPSVSIMTGDADFSGHNVTFWHKGGDPLVKSDLKIIFSNDQNRAVENYNNITINNSSQQTTFLPGDYMVVSTSEDVRGWDVQIATTRSVIFFGRIGK